MSTTRQTKHAECSIYAIPINSYLVVTVLRAFERSWHEYHNGRRAYIIDEIQHLTDVTVSFAGVRLTGTLTGREDAIATVYVKDREYAAFTFSWRTICRAVNRGLTLRL